MSNETCDARHDWYPEVRCGYPAGHPGVWHGDGFHSWKPADAVSYSVLKSMRDERDSLKADYEGACKTIAEMHGAVMGWGNGPKRGVVEDVIDVVAERDAFRAVYEAARQTCRNLSIEWQVCAGLATKPLEPWERTDLLADLRAGLAAVDALADLRAAISAVEGRENSTQHIRGEENARSVSGPHIDGRRQEVRTRDFGSVRRAGEQTGDLMPTGARDVDLHDEARRSGLLREEGDGQAQKSIDALNVSEGPGAGNTGGAANAEEPDNPSRTAYVITANPDPSDSSEPSRPIAATGAPPPVGGLETGDLSGDVDDTVATRAVTPMLTSQPGSSPGVPTRDLQRLYELERALYFLTVGGETAAFLDGLDVPWAVARELDEARALWEGGQSARCLPESTYPSDVSKKAANIDTLIADLEALADRWASWIKPGHTYGSVDADVYAFGWDNGMRKAANELRVLIEKARGS